MCRRHRGLIFLLATAPVQYQRCRFRCSNNIAHALERLKLALQVRHFDSVDDMPLATAGARAADKAHNIGA